MNKGFFHFLGGANSGVGFENGIYPVILSEINSIKIADENQGECCVSMRLPVCQADRSGFARQLRYGCCGSTPRGTRASEGIY